MMIVGNEKDVSALKIESSEVKNAAMKVLIDSTHGWSDHVMRIVELDEDGYTPKHNHPWPHINFMIEGQGILHLEGRNETVEAGSYAFVPGNTLHQFRNTGKGRFRFICIVPKEGHI